MRAAARYAIFFLATFAVAHEEDAEMIAACLLDGRYVPRFAPGNVTNPRPGDATCAMLARISSLTDQCGRSETYVGGRCVCPDRDAQCGDITPFDNGVIYASCITAAAAIAVHVLYELRRGIARRPLLVGGAPPTIERAMPPSDALRYRRVTESARLSRRI